MAINRIDLLNHTFSRTLRGYDPDEVDGFLQDVADSLASLGDERLRLTSLVTKLEQRIGEQEKREKDLGEMLVASRKMVEEMKLAAQKEAQLIIEAAQVRAENLTNQANQRLARILEETADARKIKMQFEFRLRALIEGHLKLLEISGHEDEVYLESAETRAAHSALDANGSEGGTKDD